MKKTLIRLLSMSICVMLLLTSVAFAEETDFSGIDWDAIGWQPDPENLEYKAKTDPITLSYYVNFSWFGLNWDDPTAERMTERMIAKAEENAIPWQGEVMAGHTGTNGWHMQIVREGIATSVVSLPLKYMHTPIEVLDLDDVEYVARLLAAFAENLGEEAETLC